MNRVFPIACATLLAALVLPAVANAQAYGSNDKYMPDPGVTLKVTVAISRWAGDKKVGNSPYVLMVVPSWGARAERGIEGEATSLQMGSDYPLGYTTTVTDGKSVSAMSYKALGTNVRITAKPADEGRYTLYVMVQDTQVDKPAANNLPPSFQTFRADNRLTMRDGQTVQYTMATDAISGQVLRLDVTMNVIK